MIKTTMILCLSILLVSGCMPHMGNKDVTLKDLVSCYKAAESYRLNHSNVKTTKHKKCLKMSQEYGSDYYISANLNSLGAVEHKKLNYGKALNYFKESLEVAKVNDMRQQQVILYNNFASVYTSQQHYDKALDYIEKSINLSLKTSYYKSINYSLETLERISSKTSYKKMCVIMNDISKNIKFYAAVEKKYKDIYSKECTVNKKNST